MILPSRPWILTGIVWLPGHLRLSASTDRGPLLEGATERRALEVKALRLSHLADLLRGAPVRSPQ
jgi:hypothetical protein